MVRWSRFTQLILALFFYQFLIFSLIVPEAISQELDLAIDDYFMITSPKDNSAVWRSVPIELKYGDKWIGKVGNMLRRNS